MQVNWNDLRETAEAGIAGAARDRAGNVQPESKANLVFYLVSRFIVVLVAVMLVELAIVWLERTAMLPLAQSFLLDFNSTRSPEDASLIEILRWIWLLLLSIVGLGPFTLTNFASRYAIGSLVIAMLLLLIAPVIVGALAYSTLVIRKVREMQKAREQELERIEQQRNQFITDIAHDLRTPLMAISGMSHALADGLVRDEAMHDEYLRSIRDKTDKMGELVNIVFDYTKLGSGNFELDRKPLDLSELLLREAAAAYTDAEEAGIMLTTSIAEARTPVLADPVQLVRVISNLISYAIRHNAAGTEVAVMLVPHAGAVYAIVADTGKPLEGDAESLFQPFAQGNRARTEEHGGHGLGLSICKRIADMHGFELSIVQPYGRFTKAFALHCPLCE